MEDRAGIPLRADFAAYDLRVPMLPAFPAGFGIHASASMQTYRALLRAMAMEAIVPVRGNPSPWFISLPWAHGGMDALLAALDLHVRTHLLDVRRLGVEGTLRLLARPRVIRRLAGRFVRSRGRVPEVPLRPLSSSPWFPLQGHEELAPTGKCIHPRLPLDGDGGMRERERAFLRQAEGDPGIQALCRLHTGHPFPCLPYSDAQGRILGYRPRYLLRTRTTVYLIDMEKVDGSVQDTLRYWCRLVNVLPPESRDGLRWLHASLADCDLAAARNRTALHALLVRARSARRPDAPAG